jgi:nucleotide-binding universal stress UspA family protein
MMVSASNSGFQMKNAAVLVVIGKSSQPAEMEVLATTAREQGLMLSLLAIGEMPQLPTYVYGVGHYGSFVVPEGWQDDVAQENAALASTCQKIENYFAEQGVSVSASVLCADLPALNDAVARLALTCDFVVIADSLRSFDVLFRSAVHSALFRSPAGVVLNNLSSAKALVPGCVLIAWNSGLPAARAIHAAWPILKTAKEVVVAIIDPVMTQYRDGEDPGADVAQWLSHHGCNVSVQQAPSGGQPLDAALLKKATEVGADLIVMGGYDHSRMREIIFGGTTRSMVEQSDFPILLAH